MFHADIAELRRHKRAFLKLATKITFSRLQDAAAAQRLFVDYLRQQEVQQMATRP
jgi:protein KTI12